MLKLFRFKKSEQQISNVCDNNYQAAQLMSQSSIPQHLYFMWEQHNITILKVDLLKQPNYLKLLYLLIYLLERSFRIWNGNLRWSKSGWK